MTSLERLKKLCTSPTMTYSDKHEKGFVAPLLANFILNTNNNAIKNSDGRRYFVVDISPKYLKDYIPNNRGIDRVVC